MMSAIDVPKSKSISAAFMAIKAMTLGIILSTQVKSADNDCSQSVQTISELAWVFFLLGALLDLLSLIYFYATKHFSRLEYYVFFIFHVLITGLTIVLAFSFSKSNGSSCSIRNTFLGTILCLNLGLICSIFFVMMFNLYFVLKYAHFGCNIVWAFLWAAGINECQHFGVSLVGFLHGFLSVMGLVSFLVMNLMKKTSVTSKGWKQFYVISIIIMVFSYLLILLSSLSDISCPSTNLFVKSYRIFGIFQIISPVLLLIFLNTEMGDPREMILTRNAKVLTGQKQNVNFTVNDIQ